MHPLAILVVWTFLDFERVKVQKNEKKNFDSTFLSDVFFHNFFFNLFNSNNQHIYRKARTRATKKFPTHVALNPLLHIENGKKPTFRGKK